MPKTFEDLENLRWGRENPDSTLSRATTTMSLKELHPISPSVVQEYSGGVGVVDDKGKLLLVEHKELAHPLIA